jgi:capsular polysaccharide biosynthesis protein
VPDLSVDEVDPSVEVAAATIRRAIRRWLALVLAFALVGALLAYLVSTTRPITYSATARIFLSAESPFDAFPSRSQPDAARYLQTQADFINSPAVVVPARTSIGLRTTGQAAGAIVARPTLGSDAMTVTVSETTSDRAVRLADATVAAYSAHRRQEVDDGTARAIAQAGGDKTRVVDILSRAATYGNGVASVDRATPASSTAGAPRRDALIGLIAGFFTGIVAAGLLEWGTGRTDRVIEKYESLLSVPLLGRVPVSRPSESGRRWRVVSTDGSRPEETSAYAALAAAITVAAQARGYRSVLLVAPGAPAAAVHVGVNVAIATSMRSRPITMVVVEDDSSVAARVAADIATACEIAMADPALVAVRDLWSVGRMPREVDDPSNLTVIVTESDLGTEQTMRLMADADALVVVLASNADDSLSRTLRHALHVTGVPLLGFVLADRSPRASRMFRPGSWRIRLGRGLPPQRLHSGAARPPSATRSGQSPVM